ncbi:MAG: ATP-binding protein [Paracoccus sp. (in: a-proteobacteria)]|nr:ATP-binding protein [Paracoccus sp. (in: a-proteobacteria)]
MSSSSNRRAQALLDGVPIPMLAVDAEARIIAANPAAVALVGDPAIGRPFVTVLRHPAIVAAVEDVLAGKAYETLASDPDLPAPVGGVALRAQFGLQGRNVSAEVTVAPLAGVIGAGATVALIDRSGAEAADQMRRDFVANVSHELRTPLTAMMGFLETLRGPARDDPRARGRFLDIMEREAERMNRLISDLLSLSRVEAEERRRPATSVDLTAVLRAVLATLGPALRAEGIVPVIEGLDRKVVLPGDADQLTQVFQNLIVNALKYGGSGGHLGVRLVEVAHEPQLRGPAWAVEIVDHGPGIDGIHLPRLTERFYRVDGHRSRDEGGTGLGLAIVKHIVLRHRGRLKITSQVGQGSVFSVILPQNHGRS